MNYIKNKNMKYKLDLTEKDSFNKIKTLNPKEFDFAICYKFNTFLKSKQTLDNFLKILNFNSTPNFKFIISFIDSQQISKLQQTSYINNNNQIVYYIEKQTQSPIFNTWKIFINEITNENQLYENIIDYSYLSDYFLSNGYKCIESQLYKDFTQHLLDKIEPVSFNENLLRYCVFEKIQNFNIPNTLNLSIYNNSLLNQTNGIYYHNIKTLYDIIDIINFIDNKINKNDFNDIIITINNLYDILQLFNKFEYIFNIINDNILDICKKAICLYKAKSITITDEIETEETNFYIIFYNNILLLDPNLILKEITKTQRLYIIKQINQKFKNLQKIKLKEIKNYLKLLNINYKKLSKQQMITILNNLL